MRRGGLLAGSAGVGWFGHGLAGQAGLVGQDDGLYPVPKLDFGEDPGHVGLDCCLAEGQLSGEFVHLRAVE